MTSKVPPNAVMLAVLVPAPPLNRTVPLVDVVISPAFHAPPLFKESVPPLFTMVVLDNVPPDARASVPPLIRFVPAPERAPLKVSVSPRLKVNDPLLVMAGMFRLPPLLVMIEPLAMRRPVADTVPPLMFNTDELDREIPLVTESEPPATVSRELVAPALRPTFTLRALTSAVLDMVTSPLEPLPALRSPVMFAVPPPKVATPLAPHPTLRLCCCVAKLVPALNVPPDMLK